MHIRNIGAGGIDKNGYRRLRRDGKEVHEHRWMMEQHLGYKLPRHVEVHHKNLNRADNRLANFELAHKGRGYAKPGEKVHYPGHSIKECVAALRALGCQVDVPASVRKVWG